MNLSSFLIVSAVSILAFGARVTFTPWIIALLLIAQFTFASLGMLMAAVTVSMESAAVGGNLISIPRLFPSGVFFPVNTFPGYLQTIAHLSLPPTIWSTGSTT
jgi:ABC-2 type transport system permease protein